MLLLIGLFGKQHFIKWSNVKMLKELITSEATRIENVSVEIIYL